jgi:hypothetical protein
MSDKSSLSLSIIINCSGYKLTTDLVFYGQYYYVRSGNRTAVAKLTKTLFIQKIDREVQTFVGTVQTILGTLGYTDDNR